MSNSKPSTQRWNEYLTGPYEKPTTAIAEGFDVLVTQRTTFTENMGLVCRLVRTRAPTDLEISDVFSNGRKPDHVLVASKGRPFFRGVFDRERQHKYTEILKHIRDMAERLMSDTTVMGLFEVVLESQGQHVEAALIAIRKKIREAFEGAHLQSRFGDYFHECILNVRGTSPKEELWRIIPEFFWCDIVMTEMPEGQLFIFD